MFSIDCMHMNANYIALGGIVKFYYILSLQKSQIKVFHISQERVPFSCYNTFLLLETICIYILIKLKYEFIC